MKYSALSCNTVQYSAGQCKEYELKCSEGHYNSTGIGADLGFQVLPNEDRQMDNVRTVCSALYFSVEYCAVLSGVLYVVQCSAAHYILCPLCSVLQWSKLCKV